MSDLFTIPDAVRYVIAARMKRATGCQCPRPGYDNAGECSRCGKPVAKPVQLDPPTLAYPLTTTPRRALMSMWRERGAL